jgi:hypothetical protein
MPKAIVSAKVEMGFMIPDLSELLTAPEVSASVLQISTRSRLGLRRAIVS